MLLNLLEPKFDSYLSLKLKVLVSAFVLKRSILPCLSHSAEGQGHVAAEKVFKIF